MGRRAKRRQEAALAVRERLADVLDEHKAGTRLNWDGSLITLSESDYQRIADAAIDTYLKGLQ